ncbi:outer membrane beta-barrel protein [Pseudomonas profundi]|uniref:outer membrane beta-barrel protein n=1 Tax=Pseudomonas profundi TaxID=1981513 RepID=UPI00123BE787|nr:outer membrane beta-barrel protein [Pseudomonas profundi]
MTADALADNDFYGGASIGQATIEACDGVTNCDDEDTSWKIFGGWEMNPNIAFEAGWVDFGEITGSVGGSAVSAEVDGWTLAAKGILPINEQFGVFGVFGVFGKFGAIMWDVKGSGAASGTSDDGTDLMYGLGAQYMITNQFGIVGEWEWFDIDSDVDLFSVGVLFKF